MDIRPIRSGDDAALAKIIRNSLETHKLTMAGTAYHDPELNHLSKYYRQTQTASYFVLVNQDKVLGGIGVAPFDENNHIAELQKLYLTDSVKGQGWGKKLMEKAIDFATENGFDHLYLETHDNLQPALRLYKKYHFKELKAPLLGSVHSAMTIFMLKEL